MKLMKKFIPAVVCLLSLFVLFSGAYTAFAYDAITVNIPVNCIEVYGNNTHTYEVKIEPENEDTPAPVSDVLTISEDGSGSFEINLTEPGTSHYNVYEIAGSDANIQYDSSSYEIVLYAENTEDDGLRYAITAYMKGTDSKSEQISFQDNVLYEKRTFSSETTTTVSETTTTAAEVTTSVTTKEQTTEFKIMNSILTGDTFPAHAIRLVMLVSALTAIFAFLFKRNHEEEEDENE